MNPGSWPRRLWILMAAGFAIRAVALLLFPQLKCVADECFYTDLATRLAAGEGFQPHAGHYWPPAYIGFLAVHLQTGLGLLGARATQILLSTALIPLVYALGARAASSHGEERSRCVGLWAAGLIAVHPTLIAYSHYLWSETLFLPLFTGGFLLLLMLADEPAPGRALAAGALMGGACLIKVMPLYLVPLLAAWIGVRGGRRHAVAGVLVVVAMFAVILPWSLRNLSTYGRFVLVETTTGKNLVRGNNDVAPSNWDWGTLRRTPGVLARAGCPEQEPVALNACLSRRGVEMITAAPGRFVRRIPLKMADLFNPTSFLVRHIRRGLYGDWPLPLAHAAVLAVAFFQMLVMALAVVGWVAAPAGAARTQFVLLLLYLMAVHTVTFAMSRFRIPLEPWLAVGAALLLAAPRDTLRALAPGPRVLAGALLVLLLAGWGARVGALFHQDPPGRRYPLEERAFPGNED